MVCNFRCRFTIKSRVLREIFLHQHLHPDRRISGESGTAHKRSSTDRYRVKNHYDSMKNAESNQVIVRTTVPQLSVHEQLYFKRVCHVASSIRSAWFSRLISTRRNWKPTKFKSREWYWPKIQSTLEFNRRNLIWEKVISGLIHGFVPISYLFYATQIILFFFFPIFLFFFRL